MHDTYIYIYERSGVSIPGTGADPEFFLGGVPTKELPF